MIRAVRRWAARHTAEGRYSPVGQTFHWVMAALILFQLGWGWWMARLDVGGEKLAAYDVHARVGLLMLVLAGLRGLWRLIIPGPINDADRLGWQTKAAGLTHILFYICFFGLPLTGWAMWSAIGEGAPPLSLIGVVGWPLMPFHTAPTVVQWLAMDWAEGAHKALVWLLFAMIPMHVGAALKHHFWDRHDVLRGMLPELPEDALLETPRHGLPPPRSPDPSAAG